MTCFLTKVLLGRGVAARLGGQRDQITDFWKVLEVKFKRRSIDRKQVVAMLEEYLQRRINRYTPQRVNAGAELEDDRVNQTVLQEVTRAPEHLSFKALNIHFQQSDPLAYLLLPEVIQSDDLNFRSREHFPFVVIAQGVNSMRLSIEERRLAIEVRYGTIEGRES